MRAIADGESPPESARRAEAEFLAIGGWGPDLSGCRKCGKLVDRSYRFLDSEGGVLCGACTPPGGIPLSLGAVKTWRALQAGKSTGRGRLRIPIVIAEELRAVIPGYVEYCLGKRLRSLDMK
jgi:DNA repair protein RecO (recombination protein O)